MIRKLQRKFVAASMLSQLIVLVALMTLINVMNYRNVVREADQLLEMLSENGGNFPNRIDNENNDRREGFPGRFDGFDGETPFRSRYFSVELSNAGEAVALNLKNIVTVDEETAVKMANTAAARGREKGFLSEYRYLRVVSGDQTRWIFLNRESELRTVQAGLLTSCAISFSAFLMVFLLLMLLSARIVRPIAQSYEKQKRFITDAGHELKTPITIIRADADVIEEDLKGNEWLSDIRAQTDRLTTLTNDLIYLSRMEEENAKPQMTDFSLSDAVSETAQPFSALAHTQNKSLSLDVSPLLTLHGDEKSIRKLVSILLDNAMKYSSDGGEIVLSLKKSGKQLHLTITNPADGIEKGNAERLFDRFFRLDASRNSETGGFGLGLSIAKAVTEAHKGKIRAFSSDGQSLTVEAIFPE